MDSSISGLNILGRVHGLEQAEVRGASASLPRLCQGGAVQAGACPEGSWSLFRLRRARQRNRNPTMKILTEVDPTPAQLKILTDDKPGYRLNKGAAGSGKTTAAVMRLRQLAASRLNLRQRTGSKRPITALVLTFKRTLSIREQVVCQSECKRVRYGYAPNAPVQWDEDWTGYVNQSALTMNSLPLHGARGGQVVRGVSLHLIPQYWSIAAYSSSRRIMPAQSGARELTDSNSCSRPPAVQAGSSPNG